MLCPGGNSFVIKGERDALHHWQHLLRARGALAGHARDPGFFSPVCGANSNGSPDKIHLGLDVNCISDQKLELPRALPGEENCFVEVVQLSGIRKTLYFQGMCSGIFLAPLAVRIRQLLVWCRLLVRVGVELEPFANSAHQGVPDFGLVHHNKHNQNQINGVQN